MKKHHVLFYLVLSAVVLVSVFALFKHQKQAEENIQADEHALMESNFNNAINPVSKNPNASNPVGKIISDTLTSSNRMVVGEKDGIQRTGYFPLTMANALTDEQILQVLFHTNSPPRSPTQRLNEHLTFYGLTVDDQTNVLAGVAVSGGVLVVDGQNQSREVSVTTASDNDGRFQFDVDNGQVIWLTASKGTNYIAPPTEWFRYSSGSYGPRDSVLITHPSIVDPIVFTLTKKRNPEPLIEIRKGMTAPNTGEPVRIDLTTGEVVPTGGDLIVSITCLEPFKAGVHIPWKLVLQATDGGFVMISNGQLDYMLKNHLEAPESGYDEIVIDHPREDPNWSTQYDSILYLKSRNGQIYGKLSFGMNIIWDERGVPFRFHSFVNTNGSRYLHAEP